jgi:hypothetical protein
MKRYIDEMYDSYRQNLDLFKVVLGLELLLLKFLVVWVHLEVAIH